MGTGRQVALLRGINVGRAKRIAMADLRELVESLGWTEVRTLLNSGNIVFTASGITPRDAAARIEDALPARFGFSARVIGLSAGELADAVAENPFGDIATDPTRLFVAVLASPGDRERLAPLLREDWSPEALALGSRVAFIWCPEGLLASRLFEAVGKALGDAVTTRNWATFTKLHNLVASLGG